MRFFLPIGATLALAGVALAHAYLVSSSPADGAVLREAPSQVRLSFTEAVELRFSRFKVYPLEAPREALNNPQRLRMLAEALVAQVLPLRDDEARRVDMGLVTPGRTAENVQLALKPGLKPGAYVVMWQVLSVDTHTTRGFLLFVYRP
ncbi:copper resistance CopC family protein [Meiothermus rufus]|uniref:copper resistance CopC family protein n=1 Tax=Meiothermus rufus TaxID=604332 RepID=UPI0004017A4A|nr:copper resistance CopC family protein [Meiothermus rufus]